MMVCDGATLIGEYNNADVVQRRYVQGPGTDEPLVWYEGTGTSTRRFYHADERGSIVATSDGSGAMANINTYDEYGIPGSGNTGRFQYTGQQWLGEIGMYHYRARIYSPTHGRFMQTDPIGYGDGMNFYAYVRNDPVNYTDPLGLEGQDCPVIQCGEPPVVTAGCAGGLVPDGDACVQSNLDLLPPLGIPTAWSPWRIGENGSSTPPGPTPPAPRPKSKLEQLCEVLQLLATSSPSEIAVDTIIGLLGSSAGGASGALFESYLRGGPVVGSVVERGRSAAIGARAGRVGTVAGAVAGAVAGWYFHAEIEDFMDNMCSKITGNE